MKIINIKTKDTKNMFIFKIKLEINLITKIIPYSLKNKKININLPISILNPLINSLSPSSKSKGARLVSIKDTKTHKISQIKFISQAFTTHLFKENLFHCVNTMKKIKIRATSKDNLWSNPRKLPNLEKLLTVLQPVKIIE
jgi:hypothetical protein